MSGKNKPILKGKVLGRLSEGTTQLTTPKTDVCAADKQCSKRARTERLAARQEKVQGKTEGPEEHLRDEEVALACTHACVISRRTARKSILMS